MTGIPRSALALGLAGLIPFLWGLATLYHAGLADWTTGLVGGRFTGPYIQLFYGTIILSFMSGVLWGFATRASGTQAAFGYGLSVVPALWVFFMTGDGVVSTATNLITGFLGLLLLDLHFWRQALAPQWWMRLRLLLTAIVVATLVPLVL